MLRFSALSELILSCTLLHLHVKYAIAIHSECTILGFNLHFRGKRGYAKGISRKKGETIALQGMRKGA
jgi:hypothetical protein